MKIVVSLFAVMLLWVGMANAGHTIHKQEAYRHPAVYVQETYKVDKDETLDTITDKFIKKNTYDRRDHAEFKQGIIELNHWLLEKDLQADDILYINYWRKYKCGEKPDVIF